MSAEKERLEREVQRAQENIANLKSFIKSELEPSSGGVNGDAADAASNIYEREEALSLIRTLEKKLGALEHALEIEIKGAYGICEACGQRIPPERLDIVPEATLCVECQAKAERFIGTRKQFSPTSRTKRPSKELE